MHCNPNHLYQLLYGNIASGDIRTQYEVQTSMFNSIQRIAQGNAMNLPERYEKRYENFLNGFDEMNALRQKFDNVSDHLKKFAPKIDSRYENPEFETDWHDVMLDLGISALKSGTSNVLTVGVGRGEVFGSFKGLGIEKQGHNLGHMKQHQNPIWDTIRNNNCEMLMKIVEELENTPEGSGSMMDNTLIVYTSNNADKQHTKGKEWPVILIGDCGGVFKSGCVTRLDGKRPINALYASLLRSTGKDVDRYNMSDKLAKGYDSENGPLKEVLG